MVKTAPTGALIFVYNADSSPLAQAFDFLHKAISPATYACNLCKVTYGTFAIKREWREFLKSLPCRTVFYHRDKFRRCYPRLADAALPAIFTDCEDGGLELLANAQELNAQPSLEALEKVILAKLFR
jgi:hypothetical protein